MLSMLGNLVNRLGIIVVLAFALSKIGLFTRLFEREKTNYKDKIFLAIFFGLFGIIGTYSGIEINGALANSRVVGVFVGGLLGGPVVGVISGLIAGLHRWSIDIGGFTALACAISTTTEGAMAGFLRKKFYGSKNKLLFALITGAIAEVIQMIIILIVAKPFDAAVNLVEIISIPMIVSNSIGIFIFIGIVQSILKDQERAAALQAQRVLQIANRTLTYFRRGFNEKTAVEIAKIIYEMTDVKGVSITNREKILAHIGIGEDHHIAGDYIKTGLTKDVIEKGNYKIANYRSDINCDNESCKLKSAVIVPLKEKERTIGTLKLYKTRENSITQVDLELALGLASLFSTQIELRKVEYQSELLAKAELKALQSQINPHFLFNAINTIVSFIRINPDKARELLQHLGLYFRKNLQQNVDKVELLKEIEHVKSYLQIEKARFGDKLNVTFDIADDVECYIPPLILQPLVENAIKHGILNKIEGGNVNIRARDGEGFTNITIKDDGIGMDEVTLSNLFSKDRNTTSVGLKNVNDRLKSFFGEENGLDIKSKVGHGTTIDLKIPKNMERGL